MLNPERERSLLRGHPWVFSGAIDQVHGDPESGATVCVMTADGRAAGLGAFSPQSQIRVRLWTRDAATAIDGAFFRERVRAAIERRRALLGPEWLAACRIVHGEADGLPGVVADRYGDVVVAQFTSAGAERWRDAIADALEAETACRAVYERSDAEVRELEGLEPRTGVMRGALERGTVEIVEHGIRYRVDVARGQKTGFYLDQRDNRARVRDLARDADVLNCFGYTGGFALAALAGGARSVTSVDSSADALALARENLEANGLDASRAHWIDADVFQHLRHLRDSGHSFDLIVLDPPKFAPTASHAERAARAYKDINLLALRLLRHGGVLATFSCSGGVSADLFQKIVAGAAVDAPADVQVLARLQAAPDHPVMLAFPEGEYLKGLILKKF
ncbi:MAG: class I SAM-dependent rRNA methyltransferase [Burkholderiales bacterium]|nr:class I SAM-dependent rRNA methyltransferase [Burkholderiales bacterium]